MSYEIRLEGLSFHSFHGVYDFEKKEGNTFLVDVTVSFSITRLPEQDELVLAPDYQVVNRIVKAEMENPRQLLESVARTITICLWDAFKDAIKIKVVLRKLNPPLGNACHASCVALETSSPL